MKVIKFLFVFLGIILFSFLLLLAASFLLVKHVEIKKLVEKEIEQALGINVTIEKVEFSPVLAHIGAKGISIDNPDGFEEKELAYISCIHFMLDPVEIISRKKPNIYLFVLDLKRLNIIKEKDGTVNIKKLLPVKKWDQSVKPKRPLYFDVVVLSIEEINYTDYTSGKKKIRNFPVAIKNQVFLNISSGSDVIKMVIFKALQTTEIGKLIDLSVKPVVSSVTSTVGAAWQATAFSFTNAINIITAPFKILFENK